MCLYNSATLEMKRIYEKSYQSSRWCTKCFGFCCEPGKPSMVWYALGNTQILTLKSIVAQLINSAVFPHPFLFVQQNCVYLWAFEIMFIFKLWETLLIFLQAKLIRKVYKINRNDLIKQNVNLFFSAFKIHEHQNIKVLHLHIHVAL